MSTRVMVVDDTVVFRRIVSESLAGVPGLEVVGSASNGRLALAQMSALKPDLITLDIEMPEMGGLEVLQALAAAGSTAGVIVLSSNTLRGGKTTIRALELGAFDFITKPERGSVEESQKLLRSQLIPIIRAFERRREIRGILANSLGRSAAAPIPTETRTAGRARGKPMILIGVSTGGPNALAQVLPASPANVGAPIFIVQHMPALFTKPLADRLQSKSAILVREARDGEVAANDCAYIAPGGKQMRLACGPSGEIIIQINGDAPENNCRPSVDYLFRSAALNFPGRSIAAILTGMGNDGTEGLRLLKKTGCMSIAQDEGSCVVFGMPKEAIAAGVVDTIVPLNRIAQTLLHCLAGAGK